MSDEPKPSDDRNGCFLDKSWCCKVCDGEIPDGHLDHCDIWQLEKKHRDFIANDYNAVLSARDSLAADLERVKAELAEAKEQVRRRTIWASDEAELTDKAVERAETAEADLARVTAERDAVIAELRMTLKLPPPPSRHLPRGLGSDPGR